MTIAYEKHHGTGNDFLLIDADERVPDRSRLAIEACDRTSGIGADGVLFVALEEGYRPPRVVMTLVQPDGSTAPMCGNGARCAGAWAMDRTGSDEIMIDTQSGTRHATRRGDQIAVEMGVPTFDPRRVPVNATEPVIEEEIEGLEVTALNTGVPHAVAFVDDVDAVDLEAVARPVRHSDRFPLGTNVTLASPDDSGGFRQRTFERGVEGETRACGTGAVAIAAVARRLVVVDGDRPITVTPPGGSLQIEFAEDGTATLIGPVEHEFDGELTRHSASSS